MPRLPYSQQYFKGFLVLTIGLLASFSSSAQSVASLWEAQVQARQEKIDFLNFAQSNPDWLIQEASPTLKTAVPSLDALETALLPWGQNPTATDNCMQVLFGNNYSCAQALGVLHGRFGPFIEKEIEASGLPTSFQWLAATTSAFDPAFEQNNRAGLWGISSTLAQESGLLNINGIDQRKLPEESTQAFIDELMRLQRRFPNDPHRVLVAYWKGMAYATRWTGKPGYDSELDERITLLKVVSRFMVNIQRPSFELNWINEAQTWDTLECTNGVIRRANLLKNTGLKPSEIQELLPWWTSDVLTCENALKYGARIARAHVSLPSVQRTSVDSKGQKNPEPTAASLAKAVTVVEVPEMVIPSSSTPCIIHEVKKGDTLWNIAQRYPSTTPEELAEVNEIIDYIRIGQVLCVPDRQ
tara:strand:+ start:942 stop:2180 length:1239 start_codon:yes stop_codon:yes gene_type:complete